MLSFLRTHYLLVTRPYAWLLLLAAAFFLPACSGSRTPAVNPDALAVYQGGSVTLDEFEQRYAQSVGGEEAARDSSMASYRDFLDRYVNFRLKVKAARDAGMEADSTINADIAQYRESFARPYLLEQEVLEPLVRTLYARRDTIVSSSHILIRVDENAAAADTIEAYAKMQSVIDSLDAGMPFGDAARTFSEDPSARTSGPGGGGALGFFSSGSLVEPFESIAYSTPVGQRSRVFRTQFGYHVLQVDDRKQTPRAVTLSHIMIRPDSDQPGDEASAQALADSLRGEILSGRLAFDAAAKLFSDDPSSAERGGSLGPMTWETQVVEPFKDAAFALATAGEITTPVKTQFGYHLIRLDERDAAPTYEESYEDLKSTAARLPRAQKAEHLLADRTLGEIGSQTYPARLASALEGVRLDTAMARMNQGAYQTASEIVAQIGTDSYTVADVLAFAGDNDPISRTAVVSDQAEPLLTAFARDRAIAYETDRLETRDAEFGRIMREFYDGLLLFRVMEDSVWNVSQTDTLGLRRLYDGTQARYAYPERTRIITLTAPDSTLLGYRDRLNQGTSAADLIATVRSDMAGLDAPTVRVDTVRIAEASGSVYDRALPLETGASVGPLPHRGTRVLLIKDGTESPRSMTFQEAFAPLQAAYQERLDQDFITRLRARYEARLFPERLVMVFGGQDRP